MGQREPSDDRRDLKSEWQIQVFYDGDCPLCQREIDLLRRMGRHGEIVGGVLEQECDALFRAAKDDAP